MSKENRKAAPVGVFDSGVGGLTVAREISRQLPDENIIYFGDTARVPYGSKSQNTIIRFSEQIIRFLKTKQVKAIVIACNTASALALDAVKDEFDIPVIGVVIPGARAAVEATPVSYTHLFQRADRESGESTTISGRSLRGQKRQAVCHDEDHTVSSDRFSL